MFPRVVHRHNETLVMRGRITNHCLITYSLSNIFAKNYQSWLTCIEVTTCNISVVFLRHTDTVYEDLIDVLFLPVCQFIK